MKTLILNGSPKRTGDTTALIQELVKHLDGEVQVVSSHFDGISPCTDCRYCWNHSGCAIQDKMQDIYAFLEDCDNFVIASPIWYSELSGPLLNLASRFQTYFVARMFRNEPYSVKRKRGVLLLAGAEPGTEIKATSTAHTIFRHVNALPCVATVFSLNTNSTPAADDEIALADIRKTALLLNQPFLEQS